MTHAPMSILYADELVAVLDKPAGLLVHESRLGGREMHTAVSLARTALGRGAWLAHRLDRATSGCLLFGLDKERMAELGEAFMAQRIHKDYLAVVRGWPPAEGLVDYPLDGGPGKPDKREARTAFRTLATTELPIPVGPHPSARYALVQCQPATGRFRQIRRHMRHINHPLIGDTSHGDGRHNRVFRAELGVHRMLLHAWRIGFAHPDDGRRIEVEAPLDEEFGRVIERFGWHEALRSAAAVPLTGFDSDPDPATHP